jgi:quercetin dioxygenase-like cupin family protein
VTVSTNSGEAILRCGRREISILVAREEITITEARYAAGEQVAGPHVHHEHTDAFYVLEGELTFPLRKLSKLNADKTADRMRARRRWRRDWDANSY